MRPILLVGAREAFGRVVTEVCTARELACHAIGGAELDMTNADAVMRQLERYDPWLVIDARGDIGIDEAEDASAMFHDLHVGGCELLALACRTRGTQLIVMSSDQIFDGRKAAPYDENDVPNPLGSYGRAKLAAEMTARELYPSVLVVRSGALFGLGDEHDFLDNALRAIAVGTRVQAADDHVGSPTFAPDLVHGMLELAIDGVSGVWHLANQGAVSWAELTRTAARIAGRCEDHVIGVPAQRLNWLAPRPSFAALSSQRGAMLSPLADALVRHHRQTTEAT